MARTLVPVAEGTEEMEAVIVVDTLRRAGWEVVTAGVGGGKLRCSRGVVLVPDQRWEEVDPRGFDLLVLPGGGPGTRAFRENPGLLEAIRSHHARGRTVAAICAAPLALLDAGILAGKRLTSHPSVASQLPPAQWVNEKVVVDDALVTSQGPGTAFRFALALVARFDGREKAARIAEEMVLPPTVLDPA